MNLRFTAVGTVATPPRLTHIAEQIPVCTFRLAASERRYDKENNSWEDGSTSWFSISAFRLLANNVYKSFQVGERIIVMGKLRTRDWESNEKSGTSVEIEAESIGHDLKWGSSAFTKNSLLRAEEQHQQRDEIGWPVTNTAQASGG